MKKMIFGALMMMVAYGASAQKTLQFSVGPEFGIATGNLNSAYSVTAGGTLQMDFKAASDLAVTANSGVIVFVGKKVKGTNLKVRSVAAIPLLAGIKYYFTPKVYGSAQLGETFFTSTGGGSNFTYAPGVGFKIDNKLDLLLKYTGYSDAGGAFGVRLGINL